MKIVKRDRVCGIAFALCWAALLAFAACGCRVVRVEAVNANGSHWRASATAFFWESQVESLTVDGVGVVSGYKGGTDEAALRAAVEAAVSAAVKGAL